MEYKVLKNFLDSSDKMKRYRVGDTFFTEDEKRAGKLNRLGHIETPEEKVFDASDYSVPALLEMVEKGEIDPEELLGYEKAGKNRKSLIERLEDKEE